MNRKLAKRKVPDVPSSFSKRTWVRGTLVAELNEATLREYLTRLLVHLNQTNQELVDQVNGQSQGRGESLTTTGANATLVPSAASHILSGDGTIQNIDAPDHQVGVEADFVTERRVSSFTGPVWLFPAAGSTWELVAGGNIAKATVCVPGRALIVYFDGVTWWPSY